MPTHQNNGKCIRCDTILKTAHPILAAFAKTVQELHPDAHVSCAFRAKKEQNLAVLSGSSRLKWPMSKHNKTPALAIDFFRFKDGVADWDPEWFIEVIGLSARKAGLTWGGDWLKFRDMPHVEI